MSFLTPLFLLGALAVALPVVFHLIRRTTRERTVFSSLLFLQPTPPRLSRRSRLEHIVLLLLRCAVLCLLALGFARPFFEQPLSPEPPAGGRRILVLIDTSASMRRANLWADARAKAESVARDALPADQVALFTFDRQVNPLMTFEEWSGAPVAERAALAAQKLTAASPGWSGTCLGSALIRAAELLAEPGTKAAPVPGRIVLITDLQEGGRLETIQGYEWPRGIQLAVEILKPRHAGDAALQWVADAEENTLKSANAVRVRVSNSADSRREQFKVGWAQPGGRDFAGKPLELYVPAGQSRIVNAPLPAPERAADRIMLQGDDEEFDNTVFVAPPESTRLSVIYLGSEPETASRQPLFFLKRAFQETGRQSVEVTARSPATPINAREGQAATLFVVTEPLSDENARAVREYVLAGKAVLFAVKSPEAGPALARVLGLDALKLEEAHPAGYAMLGDIDFRHPLFAPFADPRFSDFTRIHFWNYRRLDASTIPGARVAARFDSGDPAVLDISVGKGRVLVLTSGWQPDDSQLALSTKFVPLLYSMLEASGASTPLPAQYIVGDTLPLSLPGTSGQLAGSIRLPDGSVTNLAAGETNFSRTLAPGVYTLLSAQAPRRFAVNLDPAEGRTAPLALDDLEHLGAPLARGQPSPVREMERKVHWQNTELENRQKLWR